MGLQRARVYAIFGRMNKVNGTYPEVTEWRHLRKLTREEASSLTGYTRPDWDGRLFINKGFVLLDGATVVTPGVRAVYNHNEKYQLIERV